MTLRFVGRSISFKDGSDRYEISLMAYGIVHYGYVVRLWNDMNVLLY